MSMSSIQAVSLAYVLFWKTILLQDLRAWNCQAAAHCPWENMSRTPRQISLISVESIAPFHQLMILNPPTWLKHHLIQQVPLSHQQRSQTWFTMYNYVKLILLSVKVKLKHNFRKCCLCSNLWTMINVHLSLPTGLTTKINQRKTTQKSPRIRVASTAWHMEAVRTLERNATKNLMATKTM